MKRQLVEFSVLAAIAIIVNFILIQAPPARSDRAAAPVAAVAGDRAPAAVSKPAAIEITLSAAELEELVALSPAEAADLEKDLAAERAARGELHVARFPAQAANH